MNFLKVDRSLYNQKCSLVQITDTVDATETVLYRDIECSSPLAGRAGAQFPPHARIGMGDAGAYHYYPQKPAATPHTGHG